MKTKLLTLLLIPLCACTGQLPNSFRYIQQQEAFSQPVNTKLDLLWVIDDSGSMEAVQSKVRAGVQQFAQKYMKPTWDIHVGSITTDAYLADPVFWAGPNNEPSFLTGVRSGTANYQMNYLNGAARIYNGVTVPARSQHYYASSSWVTDVTFPLFDSFLPVAYQPPTITYNSGGLEKFLATGLRIVDTLPQLGPNWAKLLPGFHDGPELSMCWDNNIDSPQFIYGQTACFHRDDPANSQYHVGIDNCVNPVGSETGPSQCVNTFANNSVHTGLPIISTLPPVGVAGDSSWVQKLVANFQVNLTPSTLGSSSERPFQSLLQFLKDNETDPTISLFRKDSLRVIIFVGDEDDQSEISDPNQYLYGTQIRNGGGTIGNYTLGNGVKVHNIPENTVAPFICKKQFSGANNGYFFPTVDTGICVNPAWSLPISTVKQSLDSFFHNLDQSGVSDNPNYFVATITTMNTASLAPQGYQIIAQRYPALANLIGNGSMVLDITQADYSPLLDQIGLTILQTKAVFTLSRAPTGQDDMLVWIQHADGSKTPINHDQYSISGKQLTIIDLNLVSQMSSTDQITANYQPKTAF